MLIVASSNAKTWLVSEKETSYNKLKPCRNFLILFITSTFKILSSRAPFSLNLKRQHILLLVANFFGWALAQHVEPVTTYAGGFTTNEYGDGGSALAASFTLPHSAAYDDTTRILYVTENGNFGGRVRQININTNIVNTFAGTGSFGDNVLATSKNW